MPAARTVHTSYRITGHSALTRSARPSPSCASATTGRRGGQERQQPEQVGGRGAERHRTHSSAGRRSASRHNRTPRGRGGASLVPPGDAGKADPQLEAAARTASLASGHRAGRERPATRTTGGVCPQPLRSRPNSKGLAAAPTRRRASVPEEVLINTCLTVRPRATEGSQDRAGAAEPAASASRGRSLSPRTGVALPLSLLWPELRPFRATFPLGISHEGHEGLGRPSTPHTAPRAPPRGGCRERGEAREAARMRKATASPGRKDGAAQAERGREVLPLFPPPRRGDWLR